MIRAKHVVLTQYERTTQEEDQKWGQPLFQPNPDSVRERDTSPVYVVKYLKRNETKIVCIYFHFTERQLPHSLSPSRSVCRSTKLCPLAGHQLLSNSAGPQNQLNSSQPRRTHTPSKSRSLYKRTENKIGTSRHHRRSSSSVQECVIVAGTVQLQGRGWRMPLIGQSSQESPVANGGPVW